MIIKKVDDKPMIIHTKEKTKIHMHENQDAKIKGHTLTAVGPSPEPFPPTLMVTSGFSSMNDSASALDTSDMEVEPVRVRVPLSLIVASVVSEVSVLSAAVVVVFAVEGALDA